MEEIEARKHPVNGSHGKRFEIGAGVAVSALLFIAAIVLVPFPSVFDRPVTAFFNIGAFHSRFLDGCFYNMALKYTLSGVALVACVWACWFSSTAEMKTRILSGALVSIVAGMFSRFLQHVLPSHPRPIHDVHFVFHLPYGVDPNDFNNWDSFPSDHAVVWFGLATVIYMARPRLGGFAMILAVVTLFSRNYLGFHYPTDLIGGAALGSLCVSLIQFPVFQRFATPVVDWSQRHAAWFYGLAFFVSYQIATLCDDIRQAARSFAAILK